ncbi:DnaJ domain-containing protein [Sulfurimonas sp.]
MQILLGAQETIIKIKSQSIKIDYIQHFIYQHFINVVINKNTLYIPASVHNKHYRIFLLKWLYALYVKKSKNEILEFKEILLKREYKAIKIVLSQEITHKIRWNILDEKNINIFIEPYSDAIIKVLKTYFKSSLHVNNSFLSLHVNTLEKKEQLKKLLDTSDSIPIKHKHFFNEKEMQKFVSSLYKEDKPGISPVQQAHLILGSFPDDDANMLKKRYKKLAKKYHPDTANIKDNANISFYTQKFQNILQAYEMLLEQVS